MTKVSRKRLLEGTILIFGGLTGVVLVWYGYFVLKRAAVSFSIFASLLFISCILAGLVAMTVTHDNRRWFIVDPRCLSRNQNLVLATGAFIFGICCLWFAGSREISFFFRETFGGGIAYLLQKATGVIGFFYFSWQAILKFRQALRSTGT